MPLKKEKTTKINQKNENLTANKTKIKEKKTN